MTAVVAKGLLEVLADYSAQHGDPEDFTNARATVAELIEALRSAREWHLGDKYRGGSDEEQLAWRNQLARYDAALARVQGGAK